MPTDPLDVLHTPDQPVAPRPEFAASLRSRLALALAGSPERTTMLNVTPYLAVHDARAALDFYAAAFGAVETSRIVMDDDRIGHAEFTIGRVTFFISDEYPEIFVPSPRTLGGTPVALHCEVPDVDAAFTQAVAAGATELRAPEDQFHGNRNAVIVDPFGHRWMLSAPIAPAR